MATNRIGIGCDWVGGWLRWFGGNDNQRYERGATRTDVQMAIGDHLAKKLSWHGNGA